MKRPKKNYKNIPIRDRCQTPGYAIDPLIEYIDANYIIWEAAAGTGNIVKELEKNNFNVIGTDIINGKDYFKYRPKYWDVQITNPPYSIKYKWLKKAYEYNRPFALLLPIDTLGSNQAQAL